MPDKGREPHIDQLLRQNLGGQSFPLPEGSWDRIAQSLDRRSRRKAWLWGTAAALAILCLGTGFWYSLYNEGNSTQAPPSLGNNVRNVPSLTPPAGPSSANTADVSSSSSASRLGQADNTRTAPTVAGKRNSSGIQKPGSGLPTQSEPGGNSGGANAETETANTFTAPDGLSMQRSQLSILTAQEPGKAGLMALQVPSPRRAMQQQPSLRLGIGSTPAYTLDFLQAAAQQAGFLHQDYIGIRRSQETPVAALSAGIELSLRLRKGFVVQTGAWLQEYAVSQRYDYSIVNIPSYRGGVTDIYGNKLIEAYFTSANPEKVSYNGRSRYRSLRIPMQAGWSHGFGDGFNLIGLGGVSTAFLLEESGRQINYSNLSLVNEPQLRMRPVQWSALAQLGIEKSLHRNFWLGASFRWEATLHNRYVNGSPLRSTPQQTGVQFNIQYRIY